MWGGRILFSPMLIKPSIYFQWRAAVVARGEVRITITKVTKEPTFRRDTIITHIGRRRHVIPRDSNLLSQTGHRRQERKRQGVQKGQSQKAINQSSSVSYINLSDLFNGLFFEGHNCWRFTRFVTLHLFYFSCFNAACRVWRQKTAKMQRRC